LAEMTISDGTTVIVDDDDYERLSKWKWTASGNGYAVRGKHIGNRKYRRIYIHREILGAKHGEKVDHINGDKLDNRKENLRIATTAENSRNISVRKDNKSGYKGVFFASSRNKWHASIKVNYKSKFLGYFESKTEAAKAYNAAAIKYHGKFAKLNEIDEEEIA
jgi:two-component SAPR family response regulator